jgi:hypothetical protein
MAQFGKQRFPKAYQSAVGMRARGDLHKNSKELVSILKNNNILNSNSTVFELGSGPARNLHYIHQEFKINNIYCSDLFKEASISNMSNEIKNIVTFYEGDSQDVIDNNIVKDLDLFLVSDHFMHLQYEKADYIIKKILSDWNPKYIMLRELKKEFETPNHPRLFHNYDQFLTKYEMIEETISEQDKAYFIWLLKNKKRK